MANYVFGIDVGGTSVKCGLFQTDGTLLDKWEIPTRTENGGSEILPDIAKSVKAKMGEKGIAADDVAGVGIDVPGPVNDKGELSIAVNLNWGYKNIVKELSNELGGMAVKAANDANAAALGEMWAGGGKGSKNLVMVTLGTGVGGGIIVDGKIVAGAHGAGGEVGHACVDPEEEAVCNCGNHGCLEHQIAEKGGDLIAKVGEYDIVIPAAKAKVLKDGGYVGKTVVLGIRPEDIHDSQMFIEASPSAPMTSVVKVYELLGAEVFLYFDVNGTQVTARVDPRTTAKTGDPIKFAFDMEKSHFFDKETELTICN